MDQSRPLNGTRIAITRPAGSAAALARRVRALGGTPLLLPGSSLRAAADAARARAALKIALTCNSVIFISPAAVRFARKLAPLRGHACVLAPGAATLRALRHAGCAHAQVPVREDSEGLLALPMLRDVHDVRIGIVGATGGRGLLERELAARGGAIVHAHVYRRSPARLDRRHADALLRDARKPLCVLLSSAEALDNILAGLPDDARRALLAGTAIASSARIAGAAYRAGFARVIDTGSPHAQAMLAAVAAHRGKRLPC